MLPNPSPLTLHTDLNPLTHSSKSTGDPWLTDGSYLDGTGFAHVSFERQMSTTKRFDQELRLVSYSGIIFFLQHQARPRPSHPPPSLAPC